MVEKIKGKISKFINDNTLKSGLDNGSKKSLRYFKENKVDKEIKILVLLDIK